MRRVIWQAVLEEGLFSDESGRASLKRMSHDRSYHPRLHLLNLRIVVFLIYLRIC